MVNYHEKLLKVAMVATVALALAGCALKPRVHGRDKGVADTALGTPEFTSPRLFASADEGITITWDPVEGATSYVICYCNEDNWYYGNDKGEKVWTPKTINGEANTSFTLPRADVQKGTRYAFSLVARKTVGATTSESHMVYWECVVEPQLEATYIMDGKRVTIEMLATPADSLLGNATTLYEPSFEILWREKGASEWTTKAILTKGKSTWTSDPLPASMDFECTAKMSYDCDGEVIQNELTEDSRLEISTDTDLNALNALNFATVANNEEESITLRWETSPMSAGLISRYNAQYGFKIERAIKEDNIDWANATEVWNNTKVVSGWGNDEYASNLAKLEAVGIEPQNLGAIVWEFTDTNEGKDITDPTRLKSNTDYVYRLTTSNLIADTKTLADGNTTTRYSFHNSTEEPLVTEPGWIMPTPVSLAVGAKATKAPNNADSTLNTYTNTLTWKLPHAADFNKENAKFTVTRFDERYLGSSEVIFEGWINEKNGEFSLSDSVDLSIASSEEEDDDENSDYKDHRYYYSVKVENTSNGAANTTTMTPSNGWTTEKLIYPEFAGAITAVSNLANKTVVRIAGLNEAAKTNAAVNATNVTYTVKRGTSPSELADISITPVAINKTEGETTYEWEFTDETAKAGVTYYYQVVGKHAGFKASPTELASATALAEVSGLTAAKNQSTSQIEVKWTPNAKARAVALYWRVKGDDQEAEWSKVKSTDTSIEVGEFVKDDATRVIVGFNFKKDAGTLNAGTVYEFKAANIDALGVSTNDSATVEGALFGIKGINLKASGLEHNNKIDLTWDAIPGAVNYQVKVYLTDEFEDMITTETVSETKFEWTTDKAKAAGEAKNFDYYLSRPYSFQVVPYSTVAKEAVTATMLQKEDVQAAIRTTSAWLAPPKHIKASKSESTDTITIKWDAVEGATDYTVYYRVLGTAIDWENADSLELVTDGGTEKSFKPINDKNKKFEFNVVAHGAKCDSKPQDFFEKEDEDNFYNVGYILNIQSVKSGDGYKLYFNKVVGASKIVITSGVSATKHEYDQAAISSATRSGVTYLDLPEPEKISIYGITITRTTADGTSTIGPLYKSASDNVDHYKEVLMYTSEVVTSLTMAANSKYADWFPDYKSGKGGTDILYTPNGLITLYHNTGKDPKCDHSGAFEVHYPSADNGFDGTGNLGHIMLNNYTPNGEASFTTTEQIPIDWKNGGGAGYIGTDFLGTIGWDRSNNKGVIQVKLPNGLGTPTVSYKHIVIDGENTGCGTLGSYLVTYNDCPAATLTKKEFQATEMPLSYLK